MSLAIAYSRANVGIDAPLVIVETHIANGMPAFNIVGLPETVVKESKDRVRSAIQTANFTFPDGRITVNLAPADLPKGGGRFDLAIALGILCASGQLPPDCLGDLEVFGELALSGELRPVQGILPGIMAASRAGRRCLAPWGNEAEAALLKEAEVRIARHLLDICASLKGERDLLRVRHRLPPEPDEYPDLLDVRGQHQARRALAIAAAGGHNLLLRGPPGTGKTMLASRLPTILPPLDDQQALEAASVRSIAGCGGGSWHLPPFRAPHHTSSAVALVGGGGTLHPGEISLAHHGVLFLDELPEFSSRVLEVLREPLESGNIVISRARYQVRLPARFQLVAAMNPCPCGYHGDAERECGCTSEQVKRYQQRISGPLLDRIDLHVEVTRPPRGETGALLQGEQDPAHGSRAIRERVVRCRAMQRSRTGRPNAQLSSRQLATHCQLTPDDRHLLEDAVDKLKLSTRAYHRILKIARTVADLEESADIGRDHLLEAINYRKFDRMTPA